MDDLTRQLGDPLEGRLAAALAYLDTGSCPATFAVSEKLGGASIVTPKGIVIKRMPEGLIARE